MSRNNIIVIVVAIILIIVCIIAGTNKNSEINVINLENGQEENREVDFNTVTNEITGTEEYVVYDKDTGREITKVNEEYQLKIYELDPNFEELPVAPQEESQVMEDAIIQ